VVVGVLVQIEGERLGVLVRVTDGEPAVGPLDQQQLSAGSSGRRGLRRQLAPAGQVVRGVVAQRVAVGQRRGDRLGQRGLHHLQPDPPYPAPGQVPARHPGVRRAGAQDHQVALVPGPGVVAHRVRRDLGDLPPGKPLVSALPFTTGREVAAQRRQHLARLDDRVGPAEQAAGELAAQRRVHRADGRRVQQLELPPVRVGQRRRLFEQGQLGVPGGQRERARGPEADPGHLRAEFRPQLAGPQGQAELGSGLPAAHPDQAEVPHARAARLRLAFQLHDLEAAPPGHDRVHGAEYAAPGDDHPCP